MASISANGSKGHHKFTLTVTETSTSETNNTSTISFRFQIDPIKIPSSAANAWDWEKYTNPSNTISYKVVINGTTYSGTIPEYDAMGTLALKSGTQTVSHNADGTKTLSFSFVVTDTTGVNFTSGNASANGTLALTPFETEKPSTGAAPIITASVVDTNSSTIALTGDSGRLIRYHSAAKATMSAEPQGGAAIDEDLYIIRNGSATGYGESHTFYEVEAPAFTFSAEDDRGYVGMKTIKVSMVEYVKLTCNMANSKPDADGDMYLSCSGNYFNGSFGAAYNSLTVQYSYTGSDGSYDSGYMAVSKSGNTYSASVWLEGLDYQATYTFTITATDKLETVTSTKSAVKSKPIFHWGENDFAFEVPVKFNSTDTMTFKGNLRLKGDGNYGNTLYFGDGSNCYLKEATDDNLTIYTYNSLYLDTDKLYINDQPTWGTWTPMLYIDEDTSAVSYYSVQNGWYQRLGNVVTIGWYIEAYIKSGYDGTKIKIIGIPDSPATNAFGGGLAYKVYVAAGHAFECWCVDTDSTITGRTQPCNNTSAGNLNVGSTVNYPSGGDTIKLSGTICYMV